MTSTTMSMAGSSTIWAKSEVNRPRSGVGRHLARVDLENFGHLEVDARALEDLVVLLLDEPVHVRPDGPKAQQRLCVRPCPAPCLPLASW